LHRTHKFYFIIISQTILMMIFFASCHSRKNISANKSNTKVVNNKKGHASEIIAYAKTLIGTPYLYAGNTPSGFDCSGFVHYVFAHYKIVVPRVSKQFEHCSKAIELKNVQPCDIILFAGKDGNLNQINHVGIIVEGTNNEIQFIHASTSKGVVISSLDKYFKPRVVKVVRVLE
jgi:cell wall-associated NlpC family hydrolase